eukprot:27408-Amphidinium_carterae.2
MYPSRLTEALQRLRPEGVMGDEILVAAVAMKYNVRVLVLHRDTQQAWAFVPSAVEVTGWTHFLWLQGHHYWHTEAMDTLGTIQHALDGGLEQGEDVQQAMQISLAGGGFQKVTIIATLAMLGHTIDAALDFGKGAASNNPRHARCRRGKKHEDLQLASSNVIGWGSAELQFDAWAGTGTHDLAPHIWCVQEHHCREGAYTTMVNQYDRWGYSCFGAQAIPKNAGTSAGVAVLVKKYVAATAIGKVPGLLQGRVAAVRAAVAGGITFVSAYLTVGASAAQRLDELEALA